MGLTVLAVGASIPLLMAAVAISKRGTGDMAGSFAFGANVFKVTVG